MIFSGRLILLSSILLLFVWSFFAGGCAQIGSPTGGPKDTLAPKLIKATPAYGSRNVKTDKITLEFNEYIDVQDLQQNLIISPLQNRNPSIVANPRSITLKFRDTLLPNTTYTVNFGDAVRDINENNIYKNLSYTFSTGNTLDSLTLSGKVFLAETGGTDSTMIVMLYRNATDSTVLKRRPSYIAKVTGDGSFLFEHLPATSFKIYALKDGNGGKTYDSKLETFAFADEEVSVVKNEPVVLYAYTAEKAVPPGSTNSPVKILPNKKLRLSTTLQQKQDLLQPLEINYSNPLKETDYNKIYITDTLFKKITGLRFSKDSTAKNISVAADWQPDTKLILIVEKDAAKDSAGNTIAQNDTIRFTTKRKEDYGKLTLRFNGLELAKNPVLQFTAGGTVKYAYPLVSKEWTNNMFVPGEYGVRILYDTDKNGVWTPGNYEKKLQPEIAVSLPQKLSVRADWDNEREINL